MDKATPKQINYIKMMYDFLNTAVRSMRPIDYNNLTKPEADQLIKKLKPEYEEAYDDPRLRKFYNKRKYPRI
ncbi:hypothetical protein PT281_02665 [Lactobacillus sp. ESL0701]|uniref:hypothetical protein n=1 Tax=Lactobacillus sp. ESL0701 TaxID=2983217 RepID=UPI0023F78A6A|nr:hypothetical protein [Lactobacillus sp. ESL0701]MDF7672190.1 hypothetical protein [Lactobacillus sp. ESL0701]